MNHRGLVPPWSIEVNTTVVHCGDMTREDPQMKIRLPEALRDLIAEVAQANGRSMNTEIVNRLLESITLNPSAAKFEEMVEVSARLKATEHLLEALSRLLSGELEE